MNVFLVNAHPETDSFNGSLAASAAAALADWKERAAGLFSENPLTFPGWDDWDESGGPKVEKQFSGPVRAPS